MFEMLAGFAELSQYYAVRAEAMTGAHGGGRRYNPGSTALPSPPLSAST
jgi:hypothetical protein